MKLNDFNRNNRFILIVNFCNHFDKALTKKFVTQGLRNNKLFSTLNFSHAFPRNNKKTKRKEIELVM